MTSSIRSRFNHRFDSKNIVIENYNIFTNELQNVMVFTYAFLIYSEVIYGIMYIFS